MGAAGRTSRKDQDNKMASYESTGNVRQTTSSCPGEKCEIWQLLSNLELSASQVAQACGITPRQLTYWARVGIIPSVIHSERGRGYTVESLRRAARVKQMMDSGFTLRRAAQEASAFDGVMLDGDAAGGSEPCPMVADSGGTYGKLGQAGGRGPAAVPGKAVAAGELAPGGSYLREVALHQRLDFIERRLVDLERRFSQVVESTLKAGGHSGRHV
ncbi:MAG TPA: MerR family transcriptional regulator [Firmicutes bacterium]|nr:MerR family transcriptional regulator [Bacillota bacterium]